MQRGKQILDLVDAAFPHLTASRLFRVPLMDYAGSIPCAPWEFVSAQNVGDMTGRELWVSIDRDRGEAAALAAAAAAAAAAAQASKRRPGDPVRA